MLDRSWHLVRKDRYRAVWKSGSGVMKLVPISAMVLTFSLVLCSCTASKKFSRDGYEWVPIEAATSHLTGKQNDLLSLVGEPTAIWKTPFGTQMWVYCQYGAPVRIIVIGRKEMLKEGASPDRIDLCEEP